MEALLGSYPPLHLEYWHQIKGWYQDAFNCAPPPAWVTLEWITAERLELYRYFPPPGDEYPHFHGAIPSG